MTIDRDKLKSDILAQRGYWHPFHEGLLDMSPEFLRAYLDFQSAPWRSGHLEPKVREFIYIAIDGAVTHLYERGLRRHIEHALALGATRDEVMQVILLTTAAAAHHTHDVGMPILMEELARVSGASAVPALTAEQRHRKAAFIDAVGDWPEAGDALLAVAPDFVDGFLGYRSIAWTAGPLAPKIKEFIGLAVCAAPTCLHEAGIRGHIRRALQHGATKEEISEVLQLASAISIHTCTHAVPALVDAAAGRKAAP